MNLRRRVAVQVRNHEGEEESGRARGTERKEENSKPKRTRESKERERDVERKTNFSARGRQ